MRIEMEVPDGLDIVDAMEIASDFITNQFIGDESVNDDIMDALRYAMSALGVWGVETEELRGAQLRMKKEERAKLVKQYLDNYTEIEKMVLDFNDKNAKVWGRIKQLETEIERLGGKCE